jgi:hypothetical protein
LAGLMGRTVVATAATKSRLLAAPTGGHTDEPRVSGGIRNRTPSFRGDVRRGTLNGHRRGAAELSKD